MTEVAGDGLGQAEIFIKMDVVLLEISLSHILGKKTP